MDKLFTHSAQVPEARTSSNYTLYVGTASCGRQEPLLPLTPGHSFTKLQTDRPTELTPPFFAFSARLCNMNCMERSLEHVINKGIYFLNCHASTPRTNRLARSDRPAAAGRAAPPLCTQCPKLRDGRPAGWHKYLSKQWNSEAKLASERASERLPRA